jgi:hypothetical protein
LTANACLISFSKTCICFGVHLDFYDICFLNDDSLADSLTIVDVVLLAFMMAIIDVVLLADILASLLRDSASLLRDNGNKTEPWVVIWLMVEEGRITIVPTGTLSFLFRERERCITVRECSLSLSSPRHHRLFESSFCLFRQLASAWV